MGFQTVMPVPLPRVKNIPIPYPLFAAVRTQTIHPKGPPRAVTPELVTLPQQCNLTPKTSLFYIPTPKGFRNIYQQQQEHVPNIIPCVYSANFAATDNPNEIQGKYIKAAMVIANGVTDEKSRKIMEYR
eukprot:1275293-Ditylum_brightwellii.AAC.1